jgi:hypothetical protein
MSDKLYQTGGTKACWEWHLRKLGGSNIGMEDFSDINSPFFFLFIILCSTLHLHLTFGLLTVFLLRYDVII